MTKQATTVRAILWSQLDAGYIARVAATRAAKQRGREQGTQVVQAVTQALKVKQP